MNLDRDIAIVGMACIFPKAPDVRRFWANNVNGVDAIIDRPASRWRDHSNWRVEPGHESYLPFSRAGYLEDGVLFDPVRYGVLPNLVKHGDPDQFFMLEIIDQALRDARIAEDAPVRERTDVVVGRGGYPTGKMFEIVLKSELWDNILEIIDRKFPDLLGSRRQEVEQYLRSTLTPAAQDNVSTAVSNITASRTANRLNLRGAAYVVDGACASSLLAVESCLWRLRSGQSDLAVAAGQFLHMTASFFFVFNSIGAVSPNQVIRPFDRRADGLMVGEGGGAIVMKRLADAIRDGDEIYAVINGIGSSSDGLGLDVLAPNPDGQVLAVERAYADAGVDRDLIGYLECHGTGTLAGDAAEIETVKRCFGTSKTPPTARAMGSVKSLIGHTMPAAGMASIIRTAMALSQKVIPPSIHCEQPREELADSVFYVNTTTRPWIHQASKGSRRAAINAFGFGGINVHVVMEEPPTATPSAQVPGFSPKSRPIECVLHRATELAVFTGESKSAVIDRVRRLLRYFEQADAKTELVDVAYSLVEEADVRHPYKLAVIAEDRKDLEDKLRSALETLGQDGDFENFENIYFGEPATAAKGKIAFVMPGMGFPGLIGNYPDHLLELCLHFPEVRREFDFFEERDRHPDDTVPTSSIFCPPASLPEEYRKQLKGRLAPPKADSDFSKETAPHERYLSAMGVTLANWVSWIVLQKLKIPVDMMTGQSQGEMAALCACGVGDFHETAPRFWKVLDLDTRDQLGGRLCFAWTNAERIEALVAEHPGTYVAIYMAPTGLIFGGDVAGLEAIREKLQQEEVLVQILPYPPIHTPSLSHLKDDLTAKLDPESFTIRPFQIPLYSSITAERYPNDPEGIREHLMYNVDRPLRIWQTVRSMYRDGARVFVQVGGGHMSSHLEVLLPDDAEPVLTAATDTDTRNPLTQLQHLCATLFTGGISIDLSPLFDYRHVRSIDFDRPAAVESKKSLAMPLRIDWMPSYSDRVPPPREQKPAVSQSNGAPSKSRTPASTGNETSVAEDAPAAEASTDQPTFDLPIDDETLKRLPILGRVTEYDPGAAITIERSLSLESDHYLQDHLFIYAPSKTLMECLPVVPMTMSIEYMAEAASLLAPGEGLIGMENVRAMRWIGLRDRPVEELKVEARVISFDEETAVRRIETKFYCEDKLSFQAVVLFSTAYRCDLPIEVADSSQDGPWPIDPSQIYSERYMFHGPMFQVFTHLATFGNPGASGGLSVLPKNQLFGGNPDPILLTDPCLMDGIGQIVGLWCMFHFTYILPAAAERIEFYRPTPPVGTVAPVRIEVYHLDPDTRQIRANIEIEDGEGNVWVRVTGWTEWIMNWSTEYTEATRMPSWFMLSEELPLPGLPEGTVAIQLPREMLQGPDPDWAARYFLHESRTQEVLALPTSKKKREALFSEIALRDAARLWWAKTYQTTYPHPAEFVLQHTPAGAPYFEPAGDPSLPFISLSHSESLAVAIASNVPVGIDIEPETKDIASISEHFLTEQESAQVSALDAEMPEEAWGVRFWCAKEAVGKMLGIGLEGRPKQFEIHQIDPTGVLTVLHRTTGHFHAVQTVRWNGWIFAYAVSADSPGNEDSLMSQQSAGS